MVEKNNMRRIIKSQRTCITPDQVAQSNRSYRTVIIANVLPDKDFVPYKRSLRLPVLLKKPAYLLDVRLGIPPISVTFRTTSARSNFLSQKLTFYISLIRELYKSR